MPAYNAGQYLAEAIESILNQTCDDFELLLLDDGSTDNTKEIALSYHDKRLRYLPNGRNLKLVATLNRGLDLARGRFIARMDADDISLPQRFEKQVRFLEENKDVVCVGTAMRTLGLEKDYDIFYDSRPEVVKVLLLFSCKIAHPTVMIRQETLQKFPLRYNTQYIHVEDFDFFNRMSVLGKVCSIEDVLLLKRMHHEQITKTQRPIQIEIEKLLRKKILGEQFPEVFTEQKHFDFLEDYFIELKQPDTEDKLFEVLCFFSSWIHHPNANVASPYVLNPMLAKRCWDMCTNAPFSTKGLARIYKRMGFLKWFDPGLSNRLKLSLRGYLRQVSG